MRKYTFLIIVIALMITSCSKNGNIVAGDNKAVGWINDSTFKITATGYPSPGIANDSKELSSYEAAHKLASTKVAYHFLKELPSEVDEFKLNEIINYHGSITHSKFVDNKYVDITMLVQYDDLRNILKSGEIDTLLR